MFSIDDEEREEDQQADADFTLNLAYESMLKAIEASNRVLSTQGPYPMPEYLFGQAQMLYLMAIGQSLQEIRALIHDYLQSSERGDRPTEEIAS